MAGKWQAAGAIYCLYHCRRKLKLTIVTRLRRSSKVLTRIRIERDQGRTRFHDRVRFVLFGFVSTCNLSIPRWYRVLRLCHCRTAALVIATFNLKRLDPAIFFSTSFLFSFLFFFLLPLPLITSNQIIFPKERSRNCSGEKPAWRIYGRGFVHKVRLPAGLGGVRLQIVMKSRVIESGQVSCVDVVAWDMCAVDILDCEK